MATQDRRYQDRTRAAHWSGDRDPYSREDETRRYRSDRRNPQDAGQDVGQDVGMEYGRGREITHREDYLRNGDYLGRRPTDGSSRNHFDEEYFVDERELDEPDHYRRSSIVPTIRRALSESRYDVPHDRFMDSVPGDFDDFGQNRGIGRRFHFDEASRAQRAERSRSFLDRAADEVASWFGDTEASSRRQLDDMRQGLHHRGRGPKNYIRSNERIREDLCERLTEDPFIDARNIDVIVAKAEVTLDGTVENRLQRRRVEMCAESISGVVHVQNNLRVQLQEAEGAQHGARRDT